MTFGTGSFMEVIADGFILFGTEDNRFGTIYTGTLDASNVYVEALVQCNLLNVSGNSTLHNIYPDTTGGPYDIGRTPDTGGRFGTIYLENNPNVSSNRDLKENIESSDLGLDFINKLNPVKYNLIKNNPEKVHYGLIAQEVRDLLLEENIDPLKFAAYSYSTIEEDSVTKESYGLAYCEFIAPLIKANQELYQITKTQDSKIASLEASLAAIKTQLGIN